MKKIYVSNSNDNNERILVSFKNHDPGLKFFVRVASSYVA